MPKETYTPNFDITITNEMTVTYYKHLGDDLDICRAAWVSTEDDEDLARDESPVGQRRLLDFLMKYRHGSPFVQGALMGVAKIPIFVAREWMRHGIGHGYNEQSGRYTAMLPLFWVPKNERGLVNAGTSSSPRMEPGSTDLRWYVHQRLLTSYSESWSHYQNLLANGVAREVARAVLPLATYTRFRFIANPRAIMNLLSVRVDDPAATYPTHPQFEMEESARKLEAMFAEHWPITHELFVQHGRVAP